MPHRLWTIVCCLLTSIAFAADTHTLEEPLDDERVFGIGLRLDVTGKVQTRGADNKAVDLPLTATAAIPYRERRLVGIGSGAETYRAVREYEQATVDIDAGGEKSRVILPEVLKLCVAQGRSSGAEVYSLGGALSAQELDLLSPPCDSLGLTELLPKATVAVGAEWTPSSWTAQYLSRLEAVSKSELKCKLESVTKNIARVTFAGKLAGAVQGTTSEVQLKGWVDFDLQAKCISGADIEQMEKRAIGAVTVGLDVSARMRLLRKPAQNPGRIGEPVVLKAAADEPPAMAMALRFESPWQLSALHNRDWHLYQEAEQVAIFRLLDEGLFVAQCNLAPIPAAKPGEHTSPETFEKDIRQSLGERLKTLSSGEVIPTSDRRYIYRIVADGAVGDRKLRWIYFLMADPSGRQASALFALDTALQEKLGTRDRELVESIRFGAPPVTAILRTGGKQ